MKRDLGDIRVICDIIFAITLNSDVNSFLNLRSRKRSEVIFKVMLYKTVFLPLMKILM